MKDIQNITVLSLLFFIWIYTGVFAAASSWTASPTTCFEYNITADTANRDGCLQKCSNLGTQLAYLNSTLFSVLKTELPLKHKWLWVRGDTTEYCVSINWPNLTSISCANTYQCLCERLQTTRTAKNCLSQSFPFGTSSSFPLFTQLTNLSQTIRMQSDIQDLTASSFILETFTGQPSNASSAISSTFSVSDSSTQLGSWNLQSSFEITSLISDYPDVVSLHLPSQSSNVMTETEFDLMHNNSSLADFSSSQPSHLPFSNIDSDVTYFDTSWNSSAFKAQFSVFPSSPSVLSTQFLYANLVTLDSARTTDSLASDMEYLKLSTSASLSDGTDALNLSLTDTFISYSKEFKSSPLTKTLQSTTKTLPFTNQLSWSESAPVSYLEVYNFTLSIKYISDLETNKVKISTTPVYIAEKTSGPLNKSFFTKSIVKTRNNREYRVVSSNMTCKESVNLGRKMNSSLVWHTSAVQYLRMATELNLPTGSYWVGGKMNLTEEMHLYLNVRNDTTANLSLDSCKNRHGSIFSRIVNASLVLNDPDFVKAIAEMTVNSKKTFVAKSKLTSAFDTRISAVTMGSSAAVAVILVVSCFIMLIDLPRLGRCHCHQDCKRRKRLRRIRHV